MSWMFWIRANSKVGMKWATVEKEESVDILLKYVRCVIWQLHIQIHKNVYEVWGEEISTTGDYDGKSDSKEEEEVRPFA